MNMNDVPWSRRFRTILNRCSTSAVLSAVVGSSKMSSLASKKSARLSGCSRLAIVSGPDTYKYARGRMDGFLSVAKAHGIDIEDEWIVRVPDNSYGLAHSAVCHMLESANAPDGVFACSDTYGAAVISAARRAGLTVPGDLMVVGFDNTDNAIMTTPTLTTVNQPRYRMGYTACNILLERMKGAAAPQSMTMETELVVRESTTRSRT